MARGPYDPPTHHLLACIECGNRPPGASCARCDEEEHQLRTAIYEAFQAGLSTDAEVIGAVMRARRGLANPVVVAALVQEHRANSMT